MRRFTNREFLLMGLCLIMVVLLSGTALAQTVRGRVMRQTQNGLFPAVYVPVALVKPGWTMTAYTDPEGWYYFYNVTPGSYTVVIQNTQNGQRAPVSVVTDVSYVEVRQLTIP